VNGLRLQDRVTLKEETLANSSRSWATREYQPSTLCFDLGVSSYQLEGGRGFSFKDEQQLDENGSAPGTYRLPGGQHISVRRAQESHSEFGEEYKASQIARAIVNERKKAPIETARALGAWWPAQQEGRKIHAATQTFQAIRMEVNQEIGNLNRGLAAATTFWHRGRVRVISFHSLEDRLVKLY
jgi:16S rRNA (cytosine1402-N4)-methyltransferase